MTGLQTPGRTDRTYIEDAKNPVKVLHPSSNLILIVLHGDHSGKSFTLLGEFPPDLGHSSAIERSVSGSPGVHIRYCGSRSQTSNRMENGLVEFIQLSPIQSPIECLTYTSTSPPELNTIPIVGHRVLDRPESSQVRFRRVGETYPDYSQEGASRTEGNSSLGNVTGVLCKVQGLGEHIQC